MVFDHVWLLYTSDNANKKEAPICQFHSINAHLPLISTRRKPYLLIGEAAAMAKSLIFSQGF